MSIISFIKDAGEKLFGHRESAPAGAAAPDLRPRHLSGRVRDSRAPVARRSQCRIASRIIVSRKPRTRPAEAVPSFPWLCDSGMISLDVR